MTATFRFGKQVRAKWTNTGSITASAKAMVEVGDGVGVVINDLAYNKSGPVDLHGAWEGDMKSSEVAALTVGSQLYYDSTNDELTTTAGDNNKAGMCVEKSISSTNKATVLLNHNVA